MFGNPGRASCAIPQPEPELRLVPSRIIRHAVDVRPQEGQEGDTEGLQVRPCAGIILILDKRAGVVLDDAVGDPGAHEADGVAAGSDEGIELVEGVVVNRKDKLGDVVVHHRDGE